MGKLAMILGVALLTAACATAAPPPAPTQTLDAGHPLVGKLWRPADQRFVSADEAAAAAVAADAVMLGETHDNPDHHALQAWMVRRLTEAGRKPNLVFEMLDADQSQRLGDHLAAHPGDSAGIGAAVAWSDTGWPDWTLYQPIAQATLAAGGNIVAGNLARATTRAIARGTAPAGTLEQLGIAEDLDDATLADMKTEIQEDHCGLMPEAMLGGMVKVQRARDASLARAIATALSPGGQVVLIAGGGHVRGDRGVPVHLARVAPAAKRLTILFQEVAADRIAPAAYGEDFPGGILPYDLVWFTARAEREDQCDKLAEQMKKMKPAQ